MITHLRLRSFGVAVLSISIALMFTLALDPIAQMSQSPFLLFFLAVVVSAWQAGTRSGLVATTLAIGISNFFFLEPRYSFLVDLADGLRLLVFTMECILISFLCGSLRIANQRLDRNLTRLQESEESLRAANRRVTDILESISDGFYTLDHEWRFAYLNTQAQQILRRSRSELLNHIIWDVFPQLRGSSFEQRCQQALTENQTSVVEVAGIVDPNRWFEVHINPLNEGLAIYFQEITERKQAEAALGYSETVLNAFLSSSPMGMAFLDRDLRYVYANEALAATNGLPLSQHLGRTVAEVLPEWDVYFTPLFQRVMETRAAVVDMEISGETNPPGVIRYCLANFFPVCLPDTEVIGVGVTVTNISELKRAEQALRESERVARARAEELEAFMNVVPAAVWIAHDRECREMTVNRAAYELMRSSPGDPTTATPVEGTYPFKFKLQRGGQDVLPEDLSMQKAGLTGQEVEEEAELVFEDGVVRHIYGKAVPLLDDAGAVRGVIGAYLDITDRKRIEAEREQLLQALSTERAQFEAVLRQLPVGVMIADSASDKLILTNDQATQILGYAYEQQLAPEDYEPVVPFAAIHEDGQTYAPDEYPLVRSLRTGEVITNEEMELLRHNGDRLFMNVNSAPILDQQGQIEAAVVVFQDITNRKQIEAEREELLLREQASRESAEVANRIKDEFLAVLSHELRSPLNPIMGWVQLLRRGKLDKFKTRYALETIERNAKLQTQLIEDLLDVSRILRGKMMLNVSPVNLVTTIEAALEIVRLSAEAKQIQIRLDRGTKESVVIGDATRLQQIIWNLLSNAIKFTPDGGLVEVRLEEIQEGREDGEVRGDGEVKSSLPSLSPSSSSSPSSSPSPTYAQITISDTGKGISPEFLPYVFDYFRQEDGKTTRQFGGLGLGLAIVHHLTELHGGTVKADSPGEGLGSTFTVKLPLATTQQTLQSTPKVNDLTQLRGLRLLVVDDEADARELAEFILEQQGAQVKVAASAIEALEVLDQFQPDVLISDIGMPDMDGYALMQHIRQRSPNSGGEIPAIALTAYAGEINQQQAIAAGFQLHLAKPVEPETLLQAIVSLGRMNAT